MTVRADEQTTGGLWMPVFTIALCQGCDWTKETHTSTAHENARVLGAARRHSRSKGHYVQVERGAIAHYGFPEPPGG